VVLKAVRQVARQVNVVQRQVVRLLNVVQRQVELVNVVQRKITKYLIKIIVKDVEHVK
jgi:hypothetical protein